MCCCRHRFLQKRVSRRSGECSPGSGAECGNLLVFLRARRTRLRGKHQTAKPWLARSRHKRITQICQRVLNPNRGIRAPCHGWEGVSSRCCRVLRDDSPPSCGASRTAMPPSRTYWRNSASLKADEYRRSCTQRMAHIPRDPEGAADDAAKTEAYEMFMPELMDDWTINIKRIPGLRMLCAATINAPSESPLF